MGNVGSIGSMNSSTESLNGRINQECIADKKIFWKAKSFGPEDPIKDVAANPFVLVVGHISFECELTFHPNTPSRLQSSTDYFAISLELNITNQAYSLHAGYNISAEFGIIGTKRSVISEPEYRQEEISRCTDGRHVFTFNECLSRSELFDPSAGFIVDGMFTFFAHVFIVAPEVATIRALFRQAFAGYKEMHHNETFADFEIEAGNKIFRVNKAVLASRSPVFNAIFTNDLKENRRGKIKVIDVSPNVMEELIRFMYCNEADTRWEIAVDLILAADKYQVTGLMDLCCQEITAIMNAENVLEWVTIASVLNDGTLMKECLDMISCIENILRLTPEWKMLSPKLLEKIEQHRLDEENTNSTIIETSYSI